MSSLRWKLVALCALVVLIPVILLNRYAVGFFDAFTRKAMEEEMIDTGALAGALWLRAERLGPELTNLLADCARETDSRIRLYDAAGALVHDTHAGEPDAAGADDRPEIREALGGHYRARFALTPDRGYMYYFCALPVRRAGAVAGVAYVSRTTSPIMRALLRMKRNQNGAAILALALAAAVSLLFAQTLTRRLRRLTRDAQAYNRASGPFRTTVDGRDEIAELAQALNRMAAELEARQRYNRDFLGDIAHEIRTPITSLRAATELLEQQRDAPPERREALARVVQNAIRRVERMVGELYALTKLDARMAQEPRERLDYPVLVREILEHLEPTFDPPHAALVFTPPARAVSVRVARGRIEQVLANLLENAFRYTPPEGRVEVVVEEGPDGEVRTLVRDTGRGIAPENLNKVFDRFFTTEPADGAQDHGSGLGLTIARTIVEHHRGRIGVESAPGQGSTFWFTLPRAD